MKTTLEIRFLHSFVLLIVEKIATFYAIIITNPTSPYHIASHKDEISHGTNPKGEKKRRKAISIIQTARGILLNNRKTHIHITTICNIPRVAKLVTQGKSPQIYT